jgi:hypothetical protein
MNPSPSLQPPDAVAFATMLAKSASALGAELSLDDVRPDGAVVACELPLTDGGMLLVHDRPASGTLRLQVRMSPVKAGTENAAHALMLQANFLTADAALLFAISPEDGDVFLIRTLPAAGLDVESLAIALVEIARAATSWQVLLRDLAPDAAQPSPHPEIPTATGDLYV